MNITQLDHLVLTVQDIDLSLNFYSEILGMETINFGDDRKALRFGSQKINLHQAGNEFEPKAQLPTPGSADLCFLLDTPIQQVIEELKAHQISIEEGPLKRTGAATEILSVYIRDPDHNLIELANTL